ncbi:MAG: HNH endonuclease signature motif containing protein [Mycobacteriaceae bacterium]
MSSMASALEALGRGVALLAAVDADALPVREQLEALERLETLARGIRSRSYAVAGSLARCGDAALGGACAKVIADVVRISPAEARRRIRDAGQLQPRTTLTGDVLPAALPATAKAWDAGALDIEHLRAIQKFLTDLPEDIHPAAVEKAEAFLAEKAAHLRPDQLEKVADRLALTLNPDGKFSDGDRALRRGFLWCGRQRPDGMSVGKLVATPELRAMLDAWLAKFAAPGMCNPEDQSPTVSGEPGQGVADRDSRSHAQRQHDALSALLRGQLGDPKLGRHNGLPVTLIVSATLEQLQTGAGVAVTAGGTLLPMSDVIRMASHAWHYLAVFDQHTERAIYLGRSKRVASADQRIVLHNKDRGCTAPGCDMPGYLSEVHHVDEWADGGHTNIDRLTFACGQDHQLITAGGWKTRKRRDGTTEWLPPPELPLASGTNDYHHPERLLEQGGWDLAGD